MTSTAAGTYDIEVPSAVASAVSPLESVMGNVLYVWIGAIGAIDDLVGNLR
jgi:hypothetical protein